MNYANLIQNITENIKTNGSQAITAQVLQDVLVGMVGELGQSGALLGGVIDTSFVPDPTNDAQVFYMAEGPGTYTNFNGLVVGAGEVAFFYFDGNAWAKSSVDVLEVVNNFLGEKICPIPYIVATDKYCVAANTSKIQFYDVPGNNYALIYVEHMVGKTILINSVEFSNYAQCFCLADDFRVNSNIVASGVFENGAANKMPVIITEGAKWLLVNYDATTSPEIFLSISEELNDVQDELRLFEKNNLVLLTPTIQTEKYATQSSGTVLSFYDSTYSNVFEYIVDGSKVSKVHANFSRVKSAELSTGFIFVDNDGNILEINTMPYMAFHGTINVPSNAKKLYINSDISDTNVYVGYLPVDYTDDMADGDILTLETLTPENAYVSVSKGKIKYFDIANNKVLRIPVASIPSNKIYVNATTLSSPYNLVCVIGDRAGNSLGFYSEVNITEYSNFAITIPSGAFYIYINYLAGTAPKINVILPEGEINAYIQKMSLNGGLWNQKCVCFGDSITWYDGRPYNWGKEQGQVAKGYESYMRELGMVVNNMGYSGANITIILSQIRSTDVSGYDFVTITSGANDSRYQIPVGVLAESGSTFDETTFIGALQAGIEYILTNNPTAKILLITPIKGWIYYPEGYVNTARPLVSGDGIVEKRYADAIKEVAAYYSLPVCDWYNEAGVNLLTRSWYMNDPEPDPSATPNPNELYSLHPTTAGYKRMADILIPVLRNM